MTLIVPLKSASHIISTVMKTVAFPFDIKYTSAVVSLEMLVRKPLVSLRM